MQPIKEDLITGPLLPAVINRYDPEDLCRTAARKPPRSLGEGGVCLSRLESHYGTVAFLPACRVSPLIILVIISLFKVLISIISGEVFALRIARRLPL